MSKTEETFDYEFRLFDLRKKVLGRLENEVRDCSNVDHLFDVKWDLSDMIERETIPRKKPPEKIANEFRTSFETAIEMLFENSDRRILIQDSDFYLIHQMER